MNADGIIDELTYRSFAHHRDGGMSAERYADYIAIDVKAYEERYQREQAAKTYREPLEVKVCGNCGGKFCNKFSCRDDQRR